MVQPPSSAASSSSSLYTAQFLSTLLSQRGPSSLPYPEDLKFLIRNHLVSLTSLHPSLHPKSAVFTHNDGRSVNLLQLDGTLPIIYSQTTYNIPIIIWLMESYPRHPPLVLVNPTSNMIIKNPHPFVSPSGVVSIPYLQNWIYPTSNLVELANNLSHFFGRDPPLYSRQNPIPRPISSEFMNHGGNLVARQAIAPRPYPPSPYGGSSSGGGKNVDEQVEVFKRNAMNKLVESLYGDIVGMRKAREGEMEGLLLFF